MPVFKPLKSALIALFFQALAKKEGTAETVPKISIPGCCLPVCSPRPKSGRGGLRPLGLIVLEARLSRRVHVHRAERQVYQPGLDPLSGVNQF